MQVIVFLSLMFFSGNIICSWQKKDCEIESRLKKTYGSSRDIVYLLSLIQKTNKRELILTNKQSREERIVSKSRQKQCKKLTPEEEAALIQRLYKEN